MIIIIKKLSGKKIRLLAAAVLVVGGTFIPQTAFAYKYYVHCDDGDVMMFEFEDKETAKLYFSILGSGGLFGEHAYHFAISLLALLVPLIRHDCKYRNLRNSKMLLRTFSVPSRLSGVFFVL